MTNIWAIFTIKYVGHFWTTFFVLFGLQLGQDLRNVRILHHESSTNLPYCITFTSLSDLSPEKSQKHAYRRKNAYTY